MKQLVKHDSAVEPQTSSTEDRSIDEQERLFQMRLELGRQKLRLKDIETMGAIIASITDIDKVMTVMMEMSLRAVSGEVGAILLEEDGALATKIAWGMDGSILEEIHVIPETNLLQQTAATKESILVNSGEITCSKGVHVTSLLAVPICSGERKHGMVVILNKERGDLFDKTDLETLESLNHFLGIAIENSRLLQEALQKQQMDQDMLIAREVQETILPGALKHEGVDIGVVYASAREVGGDFYEVIPLPNDQFVVILGDVSSKGVGSALVMSACVGIIKSLLRYEPEMSVSELAGRLNDTLSEGIIKDRGMFATIWFGKFDMRGGTLTYCNGGHVPALHYKSSTSKIEELAIGGTIVGQFEGLKFKDECVEVASGDTITIFSDGITESEDKSGNLFGRERTKKFVLEHVSHAPQKFCNALQSDITTFAIGSGEESQDDFTVLQIRVNKLLKKSDEGGCDE
ncbi:SpoIIE family protein phosphatase [bacterium AH-315-J21]|nr:SpoIIE family protein phosphatase [bacterium AH-315-J21]